jgi:Tfp pilus assembly protein PilO
MMKWPQTRWIWWRIDLAGAALCAAIAAGMCFGGILPLLAQHEQLQKLQQEISVQREQAAKMDATLASVRHKLDVSRQALTESPLRLEAASNVYRRLAEVSALASECGLTVDDIRPDRSVPGAYCETVPILMAGSGTYRTCTAFLNRLRRTMPDTGVASLELLANGAATSGGGKFRFDLRWHASPRSAAETR